MTVSSTAPDFIKIDIPYTKDELAAILYDMLAKMDDKDIFIYWQMTRGTGIRQHQFPAAGTKPNLWIFMKPGNRLTPANV